MPGQGKYNDHAYVTKREALRRKQLPCWICGEAIDYTATWKDPRSFTADHIEPIANGGKILGEIKAAHRACNSRRGKAAIIKTAPTTATQW